MLECRCAGIHWYPLAPLPTGIHSENILHSRLERRISGDGEISAVGYVLMEQFNVNLKDFLHNARESFLCINRVGGL